MLSSNIWCIGSAASHCWRRRVRGVSFGSCVCHGLVELSEHERGDHAITSPRPMSRRYPTGPHNSGKSRRPADGGGTGTFAIAQCVCHVNALGERNVGPGPRQR